MFKLSITDSDPILKGPLIEGIWWENGQFWMHSVLHLKPNRSNSHRNKPLKQWFIKTSCFSFPACYDWTQLSMISNKNGLFCSMKQRKKTFWLDRLCSFINKNILIDIVIQSGISSSNTSTADNISRLENIMLSILFQSLEIIFISTSQFALILKQFIQLLQLGVLSHGKHSNLFM